MTSRALSANMDAMITVLRHGPSSFGTRIFKTRSAAVYGIDAQARS